MRMRSTLFLCHIGIHNLCLVTFPCSAGNCTSISGLQRIVKFSRPGRPAVTTTRGMAIVHFRAFKTKHDTSRELNDV